VARVAGQLLALALADQPVEIGQVAPQVEYAVDIGGENVIARHLVSAVGGDQVAHPQGELILEAAQARHEFRGELRRAVRRQAPPVNSRILFNYGPKVFRLVLYWPTNGRIQQTQGVIREINGIFDGKVPCILIQDHDVIPRTVSIYDGSETT